MNILKSLKTIVQSYCRVAKRLKNDNGIEVFDWPDRALIENLLTIVKRS